MVLRAANHAPQPVATLAPPTPEWGETCSSRRESALTIEGFQRGAESRRLLQVQGEGASYKSISQGPKVGQASCLSPSLTALSSRQAALVFSQRQ